MAQSIYKTLAETNAVNRTMYLFSMGVMMLGIISLAGFGSNHINQIIKKFQFLITYALGGLSIAAAIIGVLKYKLPHVFENRVIRIGIYFYLTFGFLLLTPSLMCYLNYKYATAQPVYHSFKIVHKQIIHAKGERFNIGLGYLDIHKNIIVPLSIYNQVKIGQFVKAGIRHGALGYDFLTMAYK